MLDERDFFAAMAMNGLIAQHPATEPIPKTYPEDTAKVAYRFADAMMKERAKREVVIDPELADLDPLDARPFGIPWGGRV